MASFICPILPLPHNSRPRTKCNRSATSCPTMVLPTREKTKRLRALLSDESQLHLMPCCFDGLSAKLIQRGGFDLTFMSGFSAAGAKGLPDTGLLGLGEVVQNVADICSVIDIPLIADGDTGFGNAVNVFRSVTHIARAGASGVLIEDQVNPKRCGHTKGKAVVDRDEALKRVAAAVAARDAVADDDGGPVIVARTDAARFDFDEALNRVREFRRLGADVTFLEAPRDEHEMRTYCNSVDGPKLANMLEMGDTPILAPEVLKELGFAIAAYPLTLLSASVKAQEVALRALKRGDPNEVRALLKSFEELKDVVGFTEYYEMDDRFSAAS